VPAYSVEDLTPLQRTYLGVLSLGLVSADQAHDSRFRMEYVTAVTHALMQSKPAGAFTATRDGDGHWAADALRGDLRAAIVDLDRKGVIGVGPPEDFVILKPAVAASDAAYGDVELNRHPPIFDRFLAQRCMDELMENPAAHAYLMELYAESADVWGRLYKQGYGTWR